MLWETRGDGGVGKDERKYRKEEMRGRKTRKRRRKELKTREYKGVYGKVKRSAGDREGYGKDRKRDD